MSCDCTDEHLLVQRIVDGRKDGAIAGSMEEVNRSVREIFEVVDETEAGQQACGGFELRQVDGLQRLHARQQRPIYGSLRAPVRSRSKDARARELRRECHEELHGQEAAGGQPQHVGALRQIVGSSAHARLNRQVQRLVRVVVLGRHLCVRLEQVGTSTDRGQSERGHSHRRDSQQTSEHSRENRLERAHTIKHTDDDEFLHVFDSSRSQPKRDTQRSPRPQRQSC